jgi:hypothetical protein
MTAFAAGSIISGSEGCVHIRIMGEPHYLCPEELGRLIFMGDSVPLLRNWPTKNDPPQVAGTVRLNPSGRGVIIESGKQRYQLPRDKFIAVALGEDVSCIFFEIPSDEREPEIIAPARGGTA